MVQTVVNIQELYAKALVVNRAKLRKAQASCDIVGAEETLRSAFFTDVRELLAALREEMGVPTDPLDALRRSGYEKRRASERKSNVGEGTSYA
jgi:L-rhamnose isomerase/sugar isomerase